MEEKKYEDSTSEFRILKKRRFFKKSSEVIDDIDYKSLEETREFKVLPNGNPVIRFNTKPNKGLSSQKVNQRIKDGFINKEKKKYGNTYLRIILKNVFTYLNVLLFLILAMLIIAGSREVSNYFFMLIIGSNLIIGIIQEMRAKNIVDKLSLVTKNKVNVIRDGKESLINIEELVLDDVYKLSVGSKVPADSILLDGQGEINESLLTGESLPVKKNIGDFLYAGSFVSSGSIICRCERVGDDNYITKLQQQAKKEKKNNSIILKSLNMIIGCVSLIVVPIGIYNFFTSWATQNFVSSWEVISSCLIKTSSSMIAMIPTGLYLTTSVSLVVSVITLAKKKTLVQDSYAIEMLARTNVLCLDKTGTITDGTMKVEKELSIGKSEYDVNKIVGDLLGTFEAKNETANAILEDHHYTNTFKVIDTLAFSSSRKKSAVKFDIGTFVIGAPEFVLDKDHPLVNELQEYTKKGFRVLLLAEAQDIIEDEVIGDITPLQVYIIKDHIREEAPSTLKWFSDNGVEVKIISGDNPLTVSVIAQEAGVKNANNYVSLEGMSLEEVKEAALKYTVFGRVSPEQKATLVSSLRQNGKTVSMTGDGVNDILALKRADCSIAMASGSEAARNVSSIVLLDSNFACLPKVVAEGRRVINNITEVASLFLMKTIFAVLLTLSTLYPFKPANLLLLEIFGSGLASFLLALQPNARPIKDGFLKNVFSKALPGGISYALSMVICVLLMRNGAFGLNVNHQTTICGIVITATSLVTLFFHCLPLNKLRVGIYSLMSACTILVIAVPTLAKKIVLFNPYDLLFKEWVFIIIMFVGSSLLFIGLVFLYKYIMNKFGKKRV